jgi:hypothetical protein
MEQIVSKLVNEENKILRECRGRRLAISRRVLRYEKNTNTSYYVESESTNRFYFVEYKDKEDYKFCTCMDFASNRSDKCKHIYAVEYAVRLNLVQATESKLPISQKVAAKSSWIEDEYSW